MENPKMKHLRDRAAAAAWIAGLLLAGWFLWFFTGSLRARGLQRQVNAVLISRGEPFRLGRALHRRNRRIPLGAEFSLGGEISETPSPSVEGPAGGRTFLVFPLISGGAALSCGAFIDSQGRVERLIPLGTHGEQAFERIPKGILDVYIRRIEGEEDL
jgi:hypothetical protein